MTSEHQFSETVTRVAVSQIGEDGRVTVTHDHCVEFMGPDEGPYEFHYDYDVFQFQEGRTTVFARSYRDEPDVASFGGLEIGGSQRDLEAADFRLPVVRAALQHLRQIGKKTFTWLDPERRNGYTPIPPVAVDA
jgi:hypothetical protein